MSLVLLVVAASCCFLLANQITKASDKIKIKCIVKFLQSNDVDDETFESFRIGEQSYHQSCPQIIQKTLKETAKCINEKRNERQYTDCVTTQLKSVKTYQEGMLLANVLEYSKVSWKFWKFFDRKARLLVLQQNLKKIEADQISYCADALKSEEDDEVGSIEETDDEDSGDDFESST